MFALLHRALQSMAFRAFGLPALLAAPAWAAFPTLRLEPVTVGELVAPVGLVSAEDGSGRLFAIDQRGKIQIIQNGSVLPTPFLDLSSKLTTQRAGFDERGLLGLAFHPEYAVKGAWGEGRFYVYYSAPSPNDNPTHPTNPVDHMNVVAEYRVSADANVADPASGRILLTEDHPQFNHNAGQIAFSRRAAEKNYLYISIGDGGGSNDNQAGHTGGSNARPNGVLGNAQDLSKLQGKLLRIDVSGSDGPGGEYGIPADNPFKDKPGARQEVYAYGLRNTWRFSFDTLPGGSGRLFAADVGQGLYEEINLIEKGGNYGWRVREGMHPKDPTTPYDSSVPLIDPIHEYSHPGVGDGNEVGLSITGGYVYCGADIPDLVGKYIFGDWSTQFAAPGNGVLMGLEETAPGVWQRSRLVFDNFPNPTGMFITSFGQDELGELYVVMKRAVDPGLYQGEASGAIYRIAAVPEPSVILLVGWSAALLARCRSRVRQPAGGDRNGWRFIRTRAGSA